MNIIELYENLKSSYKRYLESFITIKDERIKDKVSNSIKNEALWPKALIQFNPNFAKGIGVKELIAKGLPIHKDLEHFFDKPFYKHQQEAIELGCQDKEFIVTPAPKALRPKRSRLRKRKPSTPRFMRNSRRKCRNSRQRFPWMKSDSERYWILRTSSLSARSQAGRNLWNSRSSLRRLRKS